MRWRAWKEHRAYWFMAAFMIGFAAILAFSPLSKQRYMLPVYTLACVLGAAGLMEVVRRHRAGALLIAAALLWPLPRLLPTVNDFFHDSRSELIIWMRANLPPDAVIAADRDAKLDEAKHSAEWTFPQEVRTAKRFAADLGTLAELRAQGVTHVVACEEDYYSVFKLDRLGKVKPKELARRAFYEELFQNGICLWSAKPEEVRYLHPGLKLYAVPES